MTRRRRLFLWSAVAALFLAYALVLFHHTSFSAGGSDSSGYVNAARLLTQGHVQEPIRGLARLGLSSDFAPVFTPLGYTAARQPGAMVPSYPPGLPLHMALAALLTGWSAGPFLVSPLAGLACLVLLYLLGRELDLPPLLALAGCALLAFAPTFVFQTLQPMSDVLATAWALAAVFAACRSRSRPEVLWPVAAGAAFAVGVLVRPTNVLLLVPLVFALPARGKTWLSFAAAGIPFAALLLAYNAAAFGTPWTTGYGGIFEGGMAWSNFPVRARHYGYWIARLLSPFVVLGWLALAADRRMPHRDRAVLLTWFSVFFLFYSFYTSYETWWYTRFLLPALPSLILGALVAVRDFVLGPASRAKSWRIALAGGFVICALAFELRFVGKERVHKVYKGERVYPEACALAQRRVPANGIVVSMQMSGALHYYTDATYAMWNWLLPERFGELRASTESRGFRWYALLAPFETEYVRKNLPGQWREIDRVGDVVLWELPPSQPGRRS